MEWDFEKGLLTAMVVLILAGVGVIVWQRSTTEELVRELRSSEDKLAWIGKRTQEIDGLTQAIFNDPVAKGTRHLEYLEEQMVKSQIGKLFRVTPQKSVEHDGYIDTPIEMQPRDSQTYFDRGRLGSFLLYIERNTSRIKVTRLRLNTPDAAGKDNWKPLIIVTERKPSGTST